jgi:hypothetical protein
VEHVGVGQPHRQRCPCDVAGEGGEGTALRCGGEILAVEVIAQHSIGLFGSPQLRQQPVSHPHDLGEQVVLRGEVRIEGAARQAGRQHDVVDIGPRIPAQPEQPGGLLDDLGPDGGLSGGTDRHGMSISIS